MSGWFSLVDCRGQHWGGFRQPMLVLQASAGNVRSRGRGRSQNYNGHLKTRQRHLIWCFQNGVAMYISSTSGWTCSTVIVQTSKYINQIDVVNMTFLPIESTTWIFIKWLERSDGITPFPLNKRKYLKNHILLFNDSKSFVG